MRPCFPFFGDIYRSGMGFPGGSDRKESPCNTEHPGSIIESGRAPGEGNGNPLQYSCLENPTDRGAWQLQPMGSLRSQTWLSDWTASEIIYSSWTFYLKYSFDFKSLKLSLKHILLSNCFQRMIAHHVNYNILLSVLVAQSCLTLCDPVYYSPPGSSVHGILQTKTLEWVSMPFFRGSSQIRDGTQTCCIAGGLLHCKQILYHLNYQGSPIYWSEKPSLSPGDFPDSRIEQRTI